VVVLVVVVVAVVVMMMMVIISEFCMFQKATILFIIGELTAGCNITKQTT